MKENRKIIKNNLSGYYDRSAYDYHKDHYLSAREYSPLKYRQHYIEKMIEGQKISKGAKILDVGCGPGELIVNLFNKGYDVWGIDISERMIEEAIHTVNEIVLPGWNHAFVGDIEKMNFADNFFDVVVAAGVIEYQKDDIKSLVEMNRVLKKDGYIILNVTNKYSYVKSLEKVYMRAKQSAMIKRIANFIKNTLLGKGNIRNSISHPNRRVHSPKMFDQQLYNFGFEKISHNYFHFGLFPQPFSSILRFISEPISIKLETLTDSCFGVIGGGYLVIAKKVANIENGYDHQ